jgi:hypothetical protein
VQLTYTDAAFNVVSAFLLNVITPFAVLTAGVITLVTPTASTLSFTATDATGGTPPITVHQWAYRPAGIGTYVVFSSGALNSLLTGLSPSTAYDIELIYHDSAAGVVTAFLLDVSTLASPPLVPINYTINSTSSMQWLQAGDNLPCSCNFTAALLATGAATPLTVSTATVTVYDAALETPVTGYTAISANAIGSPGILVSVDVLLNCDPNISSPPALAVGQYNVEFGVVDSNGLEAVCSVLVQVTELVG